MNEGKTYQDVKATGTKHGLGTLKQAVKELGSHTIDGRTTLAKELAVECRELVNALGRAGEVSQQEKALIELIVQKSIRRRIALQWASLNRDRLFNRKKMKLARSTSNWNGWKSPRHDCSISSA